MQFIEGAHVFDAEDQEVGQISHVVINPNDGKVTHIVVRQGLIFTEDKVIPLDHFKSASQEKAVLFDTVDKLQYLPKFEEPEYDLSETADSSGLPNRQGVYIKRVERNIPEGTVALMEGARVFSKDNRHVGNIVNVIVNPDTETVTHFVVSRGLLFKTEKVVPADGVMETREDEIHLSLTAYDVEKLPDYQR